MSNKFPKYNPFCAYISSSTYIELS